MEKEYNYKNCQSLFGYASNVHERSGVITKRIYYLHDAVLDTKTGKNNISYKPLPGEVF